MLLLLLLLSLPNTLCFVVVARSVKSLTVWSLVLRGQVTVSFFEDDCDAALRAYVQQLMQVVQVRGDVVLQCSKQERQMPTTKGLRYPVLGAPPRSCHVARIHGCV